MNKDEIKKALECCISNEYGMCKHCPNYNHKHEDCIEDLKRQELALITEQEKKIEDLKANGYRSIMDAFEDNRDKIVENIQTEIDDYKHSIKQVQTDTINTIVKYCENPNHWRELKDCKLFGGKSDDLRNFINKIFNEVE